MRADTPGRRCRIDLVAGTRPNIIKLAPLVQVLRRQDWCCIRVIFLAQHTAPSLTDHVFEDVGIDRKDVVSIPLSQGDYGARLGEIISRYGHELATDRPDLVAVFGDVDATLGAALAAKRACVPLAHIEAGLRSGDASMPEEINRILVDAVTDIFYPPSEDAFNNLVFGGAVSPANVHYVGNIMIDSLVKAIDPAVQSTLASRYGVTPGGFCIATFHRPSNVDEAKTLGEVVDLLEEVAVRIPLLLPLHPRTEAALGRQGLRQRIADNPRILDVPAIRYGVFVNLMALSRFVLTDSGGIQEEATYLRVPCLTYRDNTERPVTVRLGSNVLVNRYDVMDAVESAFSARPRTVPGSDIPLWDGRTAYRIAASMRNWWSESQPFDGDRT